MDDDNNFHVKAIYNPVSAIDMMQQDTLVYNYDGFAWFRHANFDGECKWSDTHSTAIEAERACAKAGFNPTAIYYITPPVW